MIGTKLICKGCNEIVDYMTAPTAEDSDKLVCPECGNDDFRRLDERGRQGPWETET